MSSIETANRLKNTKEYFFASKLVEVRTLQVKYGDVINLGIGNPDMPPHEDVINALENSAKQDANHGYQPYKGIPELTQAIAGYMHKTYQVQLDPAVNILPLIGSKEGITHISLAYLNEGDKVLIPEIGYPTYRSVSEMVGAQVLGYALNPKKNWEPDWEKLEHMDTTGVRLMWINYPHMPTGCPPSVNLFQKLVAFAKLRNLLLCHDNPYSRILNQKDPLSIFNARGAWDVAIELNSLSKSHNMAGWRVGWLSGSDSLIKPVYTIKTNVDSGTFKPVQEAAVKALSLPDSWHEQRNEVYKKRRKLALDIMEALGCTVDEAQTGMFLWGKIPNGEPSAMEFMDSILYQHHVFITPGNIFGEEGNRYIRISLCATEQDLKEVKKRFEDK